MKTEDRKKLGKKTRKEGKEFEIRVRKDLTEKGWIVCRFDNDVQFIGKIPCKISKVHQCTDCDPNKKQAGQLVQAKTSWRRTPHGMFPMNLSPGFPDFMCHKFFDVWEVNEPEYQSGITHEVIAVECKISGTLDKLEKEKMKWLLDNHIFSKILIAKKVKIKNRIHIEYKEFGTK